MRADFGSRPDHLSNEMCQMNTRIDRITRRQSCLGDFAPSPSPKLAKESSSDGADGSNSSSDDEMTSSQ